MKIMNKSNLKLLLMVAILVSLIQPVSPVRANDTRELEEGLSNVRIVNTDTRLYSSFSYNSVSDLWNGLENDFSQEILQTIDESLSLEEHGTFTRSYSRILEQRSLLFPFRDGIEVSLRQDEDFNSVTLFTSEMYDQPWIWYFSTVHDNLVIFATMYIDKDNVAMANELGHSGYTRKISPDYVNVDNYDPSVFDSVYEIDIQLADRSVLATIMDPVDDPRIIVYFVYDNIIASIRVIPEMFDEIMGSLSFQHIRF